MSTLLHREGLNSGPGKLHSDNNNNHIVMQRIASWLPEENNSCVKLEQCSMLDFNCQCIVSILQS